MEVTVIGHGSLMSGRGLSFSGTFQLRTARIVALNGCTRGFAKLSKYGDRFATDLELEQPALEGTIVSPQTVPDGRVEALGLSVSLEDCGRLVKREGYRPEAMLTLVERARKHGLGVAEWLWRLAAEQAHDLVAYRRQLFSITGYTSPHYIPHPVRLAEVGYALIFLAPGPRGTGTPDVVSIRQQTGINTVLSTVETWRRKPNEDQIAYFLSCLLGGGTWHKRAGFPGERWGSSRAGRNAVSAYPACAGRGNRMFFPDDRLDTGAVCASVWQL